MPRKRRGAEGGNRCAALLLKFLPSVMLPFIVGLLEPHGGLQGLPFILVAIVLGLALSSLVPDERISLALAMLCGCFLVSCAHLMELQEVVDQGGANAASPQAPVVADSAPVVADSAPVVVPDTAIVPGKPLDPEKPRAPEKVPLETLSVVLPCAMEGSFAQQTVDSVYQHTRHERLLEIIVVDDGSKPPLIVELPTLKEQNRKFLSGEKTNNPPVRIIRHEVTKGLIGAKYAGGNAAKGDVIVFLDCHVKPRDGWEEALLRQMTRAGDHRTVAVPVITSLNVDTWTEMGGDSGAKACYLMLNGDFTWLGNPGRDVPMMSGGLLALSRVWWEETGGLDDQMVAWGGENIDQSLRAWLCGGRIEVAEGSFVAHMWRDANNPKTRLKYPIPTEQVMRNKARAISAWLGEFAEKTFEYLEYENFVSNRKNIGDMSNFNKLKSKMTCAPFGYYLQRFHYVYIDGGLIAKEVFQLKEESSGLCLERVQRHTAPHGVTLAPCNEGLVGDVRELQLWHGGNRDHRQPGAPCCSGLMAWNLVQCLNSWGPGQKVETFECDITGHNPAQFIEWSSSRQQILFKNGEGCMVRRKGDHGEPKPKFCELRIEPVGNPQYNNGVPSAFRLRMASRNVCVTSLGSEAQLMGCYQSGDSQQTFSTRPHPSTEGAKGLQVISSSGDCFDAAGGGKLLLYACDPRGQNYNQHWQVQGDQLIWPDAGGYGEHGGCLEAGERDLHYNNINIGKKTIVMATCVVKRGQRLIKHAESFDGTFLIKDEDSGECLSADAPGSGIIGLSSCSGNTRWRELKHREQVQHVASGWCIDAGDEVKPITYPCHEPKAQRKQKFEVVDDQGVRMKGGWEDNGRVRFFTRCLDYDPPVQDEMFIESCSQAESEGIRFSKVNAHEPKEWTMWKNAVKPPAGAPPLGGDMEPPP